jgi:hypothetical protein
MEETAKTEYSTVAGTEKRLTTTVIIAPAPIQRKKNEAVEISKIKKTKATTVHQTHGDIDIKFTSNKKPQTNPDSRN